MPKFIMNKLIRDKLVPKFEKHQQRATYKPLNHQELLESLREKIIEEAHELPTDGNTEELIAELADVYQALADFERLNNIGHAAVEAMMVRKFEEKGGFEGGHFVTEIELPEDDPWNDYFRKDPAKYPEILDEK